MEEKGKGKGKTFTITFGDSAENHVGMQQIGKKCDRGLDLEDLKGIEEWFVLKNAKTELIDICQYLPKNMDLVENAYILIIRNGVNCIGGMTADDLFAEQDKLEKDTKINFKGKICEKKARHNLCFADYPQDADIDNGKGKIYSFADPCVSLLNIIRGTFGEISLKCKDLVAEGNYYYDITKCGIGFHGDNERKIVVGVRLGESFPLEYQWFCAKYPVGKRLKLVLNHGDIYFMSEKATGSEPMGNDGSLQLKHAAGHGKYLKI